MKSSLVIMALCLCLPTACIPVELPARHSSHSVSERNSNANEHILHIGFNPKVGDTAILRVAEQNRLPIIRRTHDTVSVRLPKGTNVNRAINQFKNVQGMRTIDLEKVYRIQ